MNLTLLVENNPKIASFYKLNLSTWLGQELTIQTSGADAVKYLEANATNIKLIIVRHRIGKVSTSKLLIEYQKMKGLNIPLIVIGPGETEGFPQVVNSIDIKLLIKTAATALKITAKEMAEKVVPDFFPIPLSYFEFIKRPVTGVYLQDKKAPLKYNKYLEKMVEIDPASLKSLIQDGVDFLYVDKMDRLEFVSNITSELISNIEPEDLSEDEQVSAADKSVELLSKKLLAIGVTEETIGLAKKNMNVMKANVKKNPALSKLLARLLSNKASYLFKHTQILTYVSLHIVRNMDWGTPEQEDKISFTAFFHDVVLENDVQCKIQSTVELRKAELSSEARLLVERHAQMAAEFVSKFPHAPMGTDQIIRQHHGQLNGIGFSEHFGANVSPLSMVFIVAEEFTRIIMENENTSLNKDEMLKQLKEEFPTSRFAKIVEKLQTLSV